MNEFNQPKDLPVFPKIETGRSFGWPNSFTKMMSYLDENFLMFWSSHQKWNFEFRRQLQGFRFFQFLRIPLHQKTSWGSKRVDEFWFWKDIFKSDASEFLVRSLKSKQNNNGALEILDVKQSEREIFVEFGELTHWTKPDKSITIDALGLGARLG